MAFTHAAIPSAAPWTGNLLRFSLAVSHHTTVSEYITTSHICPQKPPSPNTIRKAERNADSGVDLSYRGSSMFFSPFSGLRPEYQSLMTRAAYIRSSKTVTSPPPGCLEHNRLSFSILTLCFERCKFCRSLHPKSTSQCLRSFDLISHSRSRLPERSDGSAGLCA
jgi:hypothetical protein